MSRLNCKVAVITGSSSGIGPATAQRFVDEGAHVFIMGRRQSQLDKAKALIGDGLAIAAVVRTAQLLVNPFGYWSLQHMHRDECLSPHWQQRYRSEMPTLSGHPADRYTPVALQNWPRV